MVMYDDDGVQRRLLTYAFGEVMNKIAGNGNLSPEGLLKKGRFTSMT